MGGTTTLSGPDLALGVALSELQEGKPLLGHVGEEAVLLVRQGEAVRAVSATCTHYGGPLAEGKVVGDSIRCPWHHACFSLRTGEAERAPALNPLTCWHVEVHGGQVKVSEKCAPTPPRRPSVSPSSVVIVGGGAAGHACAERLRKEGYAGPLTMISADASAPYDRPNLSKDYLAGNAPEEWIPLRPDAFYPEHKIDLRLNQRAERIDVAKNCVELADGSRIAYDALVLATGASPRRLNITGADLPHVHLLRSLADSRAIIAALPKVKNAVVIGASFIGLEVAASLRTRGIEVRVVSPDPVPMHRVFGEKLGGWIRSIHEEKGVHFHLERVPTGITRDAVVLDDGTKLPADLVVVGIGVAPNVALAEASGLKCDRGVLVDAYLETSAPGIYAVGDIARWPDPHSGQSIRVEHWVVAQRMGQTAARNIVGQRVKFDAVPFFWSQHYDVPINYLGHAESWDRVEIDGDLARREFHARLIKGDRTLAHVTVGRDLESLTEEAEAEHEVRSG